MKEIIFINRLFDNHSQSKDFVILSFAPQIKEELAMFNDTSISVFSSIRNAFKAEIIKYEIIPLCDVKKDRNKGSNITLMPECDNVTSLFGINSYPMNLIVDKRGIIRYVHRGFSISEDSEELLKIYESQIAKLLLE